MGRGRGHFVEQERQSTSKGSLAVVGRAAALSGGENRHDYVTIARV